MSNSLAISYKGRNITSRGRSSSGTARKNLSKWSYYKPVDEIYHAKWAAKELAKLRAVKEAVEHFWPQPNVGKSAQAEKSH